MIPLPFLALLWDWIEVFVAVTCAAAFAGKGAWFRTKSYALVDRLQSVHLDNDMQIEVAAIRSC